MEIWEEPYHDKKYGKEIPSSFKIFKELLKQGYPYNRRELAEKLVRKVRKNLGKSQEELEDLIQKNIIK